RHTHSKAMYPLSVSPSSASLLHHHLLLWPLLSFIWEHFVLAPNPWPGRTDSVRLRRALVRDVVFFSLLWRLAVLLNPARWRCGPTLLVKRGGAMLSGGLCLSRTLRDGVVGRRCWLRGMSTGLSFFFHLLR